jgi:hypothetical protein
MRCVKLLNLASLFLCLPLFAEELDLPEDTKPDPEHLERVQTLSANRKYFKAVEEARGEFRKRLASILDHADSVEIYLLDFSMAKEEGDKEDPDRFFIRPYNVSSKILARKKISGDGFLPFRKAGAELLVSGVEGGGAFCHYPIHGIRFLKGEDILYQTSLCWHCQNFFVEYPDDEDASWVGIDSESLKELLSKEMPVPQSEIDRFNEALHPDK